MRRALALCLLAAACGAAPEPPPASNSAQVTIDRSELRDVMERLDRYYASADGLQRPGGLSLGGRPDFEGIAAWVIDVYLGSRLARLTPEESWENVVAQIEGSEEWRAKHPGQTGASRFRAFAPTPALDRNELLLVLEMLDHHYASDAGLGRAEGLSAAGRPDFEGIAAWVFDVFLNARLGGADLEDAWARTVRSIEQTDEWRARPHPPVDAGTLLGKHLAGYQGWFSAPGDGTDAGWGHWAPGVPTPASVTFDVWPDTRELSGPELFETAIAARGGGNARLFSSQVERTVRRHFRWMKEAGIDGVSLGRFSAGTRDARIREQLDRVTRNVRAGAEANGRVFFIWYDVTGHPADRFVAEILADWRHLVDDVGVAQSASYLRHRGRPLVGLWGAGAGDRPGTPAEWRALIDGLHQAPDERHRATILLGGVRDWRTDPAWSPVFRAVEVVSPWAVAAFGDETGADGYRRDVLEPDLAETRRLGIDYLPIVWPGFSWHNLQRGASPLNAVPRREGRFYWHQVENTVGAGARVLFTAMFDEVDEGTAILKAAPRAGDLPAEGTFLTLDADGTHLSSDYYLRLAGAASKRLRGELGPSASPPIRAR